MSNKTNANAEGTKQAPIHEHTFKTHGNLLPEDIVNLESDPNMDLFPSIESLASNLATDLDDAWQSGQWVPPGYTILSLAHTPGIDTPESLATYLNRELSPDLTQTY